MMTEKLQKAINGQITAEMWSANLYLSMSFYLERMGYTGMAHWLKKQWEEENEHACSMANYLIKRDEPVKLDKIDVVPQTFGTPLELFQQLYEHECRITKMIEMLVNLAASEKDMATQDFLWGFIRKQVEEEATALNIVDMLKLADSSGLLVVDYRLGKR